MATPVVHRSHGDPVLDVRLLIHQTTDKRLPQGCHWQTENLGGAEANLGGVSLHRYAGDSLSSDTCDGQLFFISGDEEEISGLGEYAIWGSGGTLVVCRSDVVMKISMDWNPRSTFEQNRDSAIAMAQSVLAQMDG